MSGLLTNNVHEGAGLSENKKNLYLVSGSYEYYHYLCDGFDDRVNLFVAIVPTYESVPFSAGKVTKG